MDRHVKWLRRRILASIATQTAETFAVVAVLAFAVMQWRTDEGPLTALFGSVVIAQLVAGARIGHAMRNNPLNYVFMRKYVDRPFSYRVARFQAEEQAHPVAEQLPGFAPVATIRDSTAEPEPVFDIYHDPSRLVAASISRASGSVSLISSLADGRILVTDARAVPPHERLVMSLAEHDSIASVITTHRRALSARTDVVELASSAHQVVLDSLGVEYEAYVLLGPALSPFLDLEPSGRSWFRLIARIKASELVDLPTRLGTDAPATARTTAPMVKEPAPTPQTTPPEPALNVPQVSAPQIAGTPIASVEVASANVVEVVAPEPDISPQVEVAAPQVVPAAELVPATEVAQAVDVVAPMAHDQAEIDHVVQLSAVLEPAPEPIVEIVPVAEIAPPAFVTREPDASDFSTSSEPVTAEVPPIVVAATGDAAVEVPAQNTAAVAPVATQAAQAPLDLAAAIASLAAVPAVAAPSPEPVSTEAQDSAANTQASTPIEPFPEADPATPDVVASAAAPVVETAMVETMPVPAGALVSESLPATPDMVASAAAPVVETAMVETMPVPARALVSEADPATLDVVASAAVPVFETAMVETMPAPDVSEPVSWSPAAPAHAHDVPPPPETPPLEAPAFSYEAPAAPLVSEPTAMPSVAHEALPDFILQPPAASLAEAVMPAPDTAAALGPAADAWSAASAPVGDGEPMLVPNLNAALGRTEELSPNRPRLSAIIRANSAPQQSSAPGRRSRRKSR